MSDNAYAPDKILAHPETLKVLREGGHPYPLHLHLILSDLCNLDCPGCFLPGTMVLTSEGYAPIEEIEEGERVFSHDGKLHAVVEVNGGLTLRASSGLPLPRSRGSDTDSRGRSDRWPAPGSVGDRADAKMAGLPPTI